MNALIEDEQRIGIFFKYYVLASKHLVRNVFSSKYNPCLLQERAEQKKAMLTSFTEEEVKIFRKSSPLPSQVISP